MARMRPHGKDLRDVAYMEALKASHSPFDLQRLHQQLVAHLLLTRVNNPRCPSQPLASAGSLAMQSSKSDSAIICPRGALPGWRLPREGPEDGGGEMKVMDRLGDLEVRYPSRDKFAVDPLRVICPGFPKIGCLEDAQADSQQSGNAGD